MRQLVTKGLVGALGGRVEGWCPCEEVLPKTPQQQWLPLGTEP